jgi:hypothetical protein
MDSSLFRAQLRTDPLSRCAALSLPMDAIAILPFYQTQADLEIMEQDQSQARYASSTCHTKRILEVCSQGHALLTQFHPGPRGGGGRARSKRHRFRVPPRVQ